MSSHYGNSLTVVSSNQQNSPYAVPKFETEKRSKSRSSLQSHLSQPSSSYIHIKAPVPVSPVPPRNKRSSLPTTPVLPLPLLPAAVTPNQRSRSFTSPNIITPRTFDSSEEPRRQSVIGLPSEYPATSIHKRDGSVVSSFASSVASSLLMEELEDFELLFGDDLYGAKVYDDTFSCEVVRSPLKYDNPKPSSISDILGRAVSDTPIYSMKDSSPSMRPKALQRDSSISSCSTNSLSSASSRSRRRRNYGMDENDFEKITSEFSSLTIQ